MSREQALGEPGYTLLTQKQMRWVSQCTVVCMKTYSKKIFKLTVEVPHTYIYHSADFPHELMAYHDFPFPPNVSTFAAQQDVLQYLEDYCEHYSLNQHIKFRHRVECVSLQDEDNKSKPKWRIQVTDLINNVVHYEEYDAVFVGNG